MTICTTIWTVQTRPNAVLRMTCSVNIRAIYLTLLICCLLIEAPFNVLASEIECLDLREECHQVILPCHHDDEMQNLCPKKCEMCSPAPASTLEKVKCFDHHRCQFYTFPSDCSSATDEFPKYNCLESCGRCLTENLTSRGEMESIGQSEQRESFLLSSTRMEVTVGSSIVYTCRAPCLPNCSLVWQRIASGKSVEAAEGKSIMMADIKSSDRGNYQCVAVDNLSNPYCLLHITTSYAPVNLTTLVNGITAVNSTELVFNENETINMTCIFASYPAPEVTWYTIAQHCERVEQHPVITIPTTPSLSDEDFPELYMSYFSIPEAQCEDSNTYVCLVKNGIGKKVVCSVNVVVTCAPQNTQGEFRLKEQYTKSVTHPLRIEFQVRGYPSPEISSIMSEDKYGDRRILETQSQWKQTITTEAGQPWLTWLTLEFPNPSLVCPSCWYFINVTNSLGTTSLKFHLQAAPVCGECSSKSTQQTIVAIVIVVMVTGIGVVFTAIIVNRANLRPKRRLQTISQQRPVRKSEIRHSALNDREAHVYNYISGYFKLPSNVPGCVQSSLKRMEYIVDKCQGCPVCGYSHEMKKSCLECEINYKMPDVGYSTPDVDYIMPDFAFPKSAEYQNLDMQRTSNCNEYYENYRAPDRHQSFGNVCHVHVSQSGEGSYLHPVI